MNNFRRQSMAQRYPPANNAGIRPQGFQGIGGYDFRNNNYYVTPQFQIPNLWPREFQIKVNNPQRGNQNSRSMNLTQNFQQPYRQERTEGGFTKQRTTQNRNYYNQ